jgi:enoyl-CoA hydratase
MRTGARFQRYSSAAASRPPVSPKYEHIKVAVSELRNGRGTYARVELANPRKLNIASSETLKELHTAFKHLETQNDIRVVVISGEQADNTTPSFCGGANIHEMQSVENSEQARAFITRIYDVCEAIRNNPAAVIAAIDGLCLGAGLEIAAACDFRLATRRSFFAMPEVEIGIPSVVHARSLVNIMGWQEAKKLMMFATKLDGEAAKSKGLVDDLAAGPEEMEAMVQRDLGILTAHRAEAMHAQKRLFTAWEDMPFQEGLLKSIDVFAEAYGTGGSEPRALMAEWINKQKQRKR